MAFLLLYGAGWTQRWRLEPGTEPGARDEISRVGRPGTARLRVMDPGSDTPTTLHVAWGQVAAAVILDSEATEGADVGTGQYA